MERAAEITILLIQDHLKTQGMMDTLHCFNKEITMKHLGASPEVWYSFSTSVALSSLVHEFHASSLVSLIHYATIEREKALRAKTPALIRITQKHSLKASASVPSLDRPKSASCAASTPALHATSSLHPTTSNKSNQDDHESLVPVARNESPKLAPQASQMARQSSSFPRLKIIDTIRNQGISETTSRSKKSSTSSSCAAGTPSQIQSPKWIPDDQRIKQVRRGLAQLQDELKLQETFDKIQKLQMKEKPPRPKERALVSCKLCLQSFEKHNLPHRVPYKAIMDLRRSWDPSMEELNPTIAHPPSCYDNVRICVFCAQFLQCADQYRPIKSKKAAAASMLENGAKLENDVERLKRNNPYACDPIMEWDEEGVVPKDGGNGGDRSSVVGQVGMNVRYNLQNAHTVRNLSRDEWGIIHANKQAKKHPMHHHSASECLSPRNMKQLLMDATKLAPLHEHTRRHTTDEHHAHES